MTARNDIISYFYPTDGRRWERNQFIGMAWFSHVGGGKNHMYIIINYVCEMMQIENCAKTEEFYYPRCRF